MKKLSIHHIPCDLRKRSELEAAADAALAFFRGREGRILLINNSGFGGYGPFPAPDIEHNLDMLEVNVKAVVHLTGLMLPFLRERGGAIVNIASTAAFQPTPYLATYGASKAFLLHWSLALGEELRKDAVQVLTVCPGPTATPFFRCAGMGEPAAASSFMQTPDQVVEATLRALDGRKRLLVPGVWNKWIAAASGSLPKVLNVRLSEVVMRKFRLEKLSNR